jgi:hypothetical protein
MTEDEMNARRQRNERLFARLHKIVFGFAATVMVLGLGAQVAILVEASPRIAMEIAAR